MINPYKWFRRRKRAVKLGYSFINIHSGNPVYYWHDPETDRVWMATGRYAYSTVEQYESVEDIVKRLDLDATAVLEVDYREYTEKRRKVVQ